MMEVTTGQRIIMGFAHCNWMLNVFCKNFIKKYFEEGALRYGKG